MTHDGHTIGGMKTDYSRTASCLGSSPFAVCWNRAILFCRTQTLWFVDMISVSSSWKREHACLARSESCLKVRESATLLMELRSSKIKPSSLGIGCLHSNWGSTILFANGILNIKNNNKSPQVGYNQIQETAINGVFLFSQKNPKVSLKSSIPLPSYGKKSLCYRVLQPAVSLGLSPLLGPSAAYRLVFPPMQ